jgi:hypothetical protein
MPVRYTPAGKVDRVIEVPARSSIRCTSPPRKAAGCTLLTVRLKDLPKRVSAVRLLTAAQGRGIDV